MQRLFTTLAVLLAPIMVLGAEYSVRIDLANLVDDRLFVEVDVPRPSTDTATFVFPVTIPGTYEEHRWWRFVRDFKAVDAQGSPLPIRRSVDSQFVIDDARRLSRVEFWVDDSFDDPSEQYSVFQPAGTSFEKEGIYVFNHAGIVGYIEGMQSLPYNVTVKRPSTLYCATALNISRQDNEKVTYWAESYDALIDGPAMFSKADTATFNVNGTKVLVALAHHKDTTVATAYADELKKVAFAIEKYLPSLPVDRYAFLLYLWDGDTVNVKRGSYAQGALEHNYSSFYFWRYTSRPFGLKDVAAHEFLHILIPLNVHSKEIDQFNFRAPEWSAHLWLYEGVTEYFANQSLLRSGLANESTFISQLKRATRSMSMLPDTFSLASFSRNVVTDDNQRIYPMIYQYGPLNALMLDILIREEMGTSGGLLELVYKLMERFGPSRPFNDDELFGVIRELTSSRIYDYCEKYINGRNLVPLNELLPKIGMRYRDSVMVETLSFGVDVRSHGTGETGLVIAPKGKNVLGVQEGDRLIAVDGEKVGMENARILQKLWNPREEEEISITIQRGGETIELSGSPEHSTVARKHIVEEDPDATPEQLAFRRLVLFGKPSQ